MPAELQREPRTTGTDPRVTINPRYVRLLKRRGLTTAEAILDLPGDVISGHRDRHVVDVRLPGFRAILKKEHRVPFGIRIRNWWDGYGPVSLAAREADNLGSLAAAIVPVPEWMAYGEDHCGRAFLLLRRISASVSLRDALERTNDAGRRAVAHSLGRAVALVTTANFDAPDLSAKHVLVRRDRTVTLIDWPRARRGKAASGNHCYSTLAGLHASLPVDVAGPRHRLMALRAYLDALGIRSRVAPAARHVMRLAEPMLRRRSIREQHMAARPGPRLQWVDGEALCVTRHCRTVPDWLRRAAHTAVPADRETLVIDSSLGRTRLFQYAPAGRLSRFVAAVTRRPIQSPGVRTAGLMFRMRRHGVPVARVLAFGGRPDGAGFLLVRWPADASRARRTVPRPKCRGVLGRMAGLLRRWRGGRP